MNKDNLDMEDVKVEILDNNITPTRDVITSDGSTINGTLKFDENSVTVDDEVQFRASNIDFNDKGVILK